MGSLRLRDLGIWPGLFAPGPLNAITDVPEVLVGHSTLVYDSPRIARTGVTMVVPRSGGIHEDSVFAGTHTLNGCGEMTGLPWLEESGVLGSPIGLTNTNQIGVVRDALAAYAVEKHGGWAYKLAVVAETYDGWLNDMDAFHVQQKDVFAAIQNAAGGPVAEGNVGGGTGMICHDFKGGIGTASRIAPTRVGSYTVGALVQTNYGRRNLLRVDGMPVGRVLDYSRISSPWEEAPTGGSIIAVLATDAPLLPMHCKALAQRATIGVARVGGTGHIFSGDIFVAFATGNHLRRSEGLTELKMLPMDQLDPLFDAAAEAVEEAIINALLAADTMSGFRGHRAEALPAQTLRDVMGDLHYTFHAHA
jgi:D-aminopeptidase